MDTLHSVENMVYDTNSNMWVSAKEYCKVAMPPRKGIAARALLTIWGFVKFAAITAFGFGIAVEIFCEAPWYSRLWAGITGSFPWPF